MCSSWICAVGTEAAEAVEDTGAVGAMGATAAAEHPRFCGNDSDEANLRELAAFLANVSLETNGAGAGQTNGGLCFASEVGCSDAGAACDYCSNLTPPWNTECLPCLPIKNCNFAYGKHFSSSNDSLQKSLP